MLFQDERKIWCPWNGPFNHDDCVPVYSSACTAKSAVCEKAGIRERTQQNVPKKKFWRTCWGRIWPTGRYWTIPDMRCRYEVLQCCMLYCMNIPGCVCACWIQRAGLCRLASPWERRFGYMTNRSGLLYRNGFLNLVHCSLLYRDSPSTGFHEVLIQK